MSQIDSYQNATELSPHDTNRIPVTEGLYIGGTGHVKVRLYRGNIATFRSVPVGTILPIQVTQVFATDTTATFIVGLY